MKPVSNLEQGLPWALDGQWKHLGQFSLLRVVRIQSGWFVW